jgi:glycine dehydrogenase subunit 1
MRYLPVTEQEKKQMLSTISASSTDNLFRVIPEEFLLKQPLDLEEPLSEVDLEREIRRVSEKNKTFLNNTCLIGEINYFHMIPKVVNHLSSLPQFYTAYTPYQPEVSQGTLEAIYEYQSYMANITSMSVSNASLYDGATAAAESMIMICSHEKKSKVLISSLIHPIVKKVLFTYATVRDIEIIEVLSSEGTVSLADLADKINIDMACFMFQSPNVFGMIEEINQIASLVKTKNCKIIHVVLDPTSFGIIKPYGEENVDIVCGEAQPFGIEPSFGGPGLGFLTTKKEFIRKIPGRIVGKTIDKEGRTAYVMTLRAREQDIRRDKATSNICTNNALCALNATIFLSCMGKEGLKQLAMQNIVNSHYAQEELIKKTKITIPYTKPFYNEFIVELPMYPEIFIKKMLERNILVSSSNLHKEYPYLKNPMVLTFTEMLTKEQIDQFIDCVKEITQ